GFALIRSAARLDPSRRRAARIRIAAAGLAIGTALASDYVLLLAVPVLSLYAIFCRPEGRSGRALALAAGALAPALFTLAYHQICFGSPFAVGFHFHADPGYRAGYAGGLLGIHWPEPRALLELTLLP